MADLFDVIQSHVTEAMKDVYTSMPAKVVKVYEVEGTTVVDVQPLINRIDTANYVDQEPVLQKVPLVWPSGGGFRFITPIKIGDNVLLHFSMKNIVNWKNSSGDAPTTPLDKRQHSLNDSFAVPCIYPTKKGFTAPTDALSIGSDDVEIRITKDGVIELGKGATERILKGDEFLAAFLSHTHTYVDSVGAAATETSKLTEGVTTVLSTPDEVSDWESNLSEVSKTL